MSTESVSELPTFYGESTKEGGRIERPSEDHQPENDSAPLVKKAARSNSTRSKPPVLSPSRTDPTGYGRPLVHDDYQSEPIRERSTRRPHNMDFSRPTPRRADFPPRSRMRQNDYDDYEGYDQNDDDEEDFDRPYRRPTRNSTMRRDDYWEDRRARAERNARYRDDRDDRRSMPAVPRRSYDEKNPLERRARYEHAGPTLEEEYDMEPGMSYEHGPNNEKGTKIDFKNLSREERKEVMRLPWTQWMNSDVKNHFVAGLGEFVGTAMFLYFAFAGTQVANVGSADSASNSTTGSATGFNVSVLLYISLIFGFSLMVNVWVFFRISGGLFNPAVTLAMFLTRTIPPVRAVILLIAQIAGSIAASALVLVMFPTRLNVRTTLGGNTSIAQGLFIEAVLTFELVFTIFMLAKEKHRATFIAPVGIGLALFIAELVGVFYTGGSLNPARSFGPCVVTNTYDREHWIYWVGPFIGSLFAVVFYQFIKVLEYEVANPGQDAADKEEAGAAAKSPRRMTTHPSAAGGYAASAR